MDTPKRAVSMTVNGNENGSCWQQPAAAPKILATASSAMLDRLEDVGNGLPLVFSFLACGLVGNWLMGHCH